MHSPYLATPARARRFTSLLLVVPTQAVAGPRAAKGGLREASCSGGPTTLFDKVWKDHLVEVQDDGTALIYIDRHLVHEVTSPQAFEGLRNAGRKVRQPFLSGGALPAAASNPWAETEARGTAGTEGAYFIGKLIWQKGLDDLGRLLAHTAREFGGTLPGGPVHVVGDGLHRHDVARSFAKRKLPAVFHGRRDHAEPLCQNFRVLVNPSKTEVLCTTIAEALAMGKWVVIRKHPSNEFFYDFPTCLPFETKAEFATHYAFALRHEPPPPSDRMRRRLS